MRAVMPEAQPGAALAAATPAPPPTTSEKGERWRRRLALGACAAAALVPIWSVRYLPMTDLPQHAAQISIWKHLSDPAYGFAGQFELNWFTPYLLGYALARAFAAFLPVATAVKAVVTLAVVATPLAMDRLLARTGADRSLALLGIPLAFGFSFYWGFLNFIVAIPIGIAFVASCHGYARRPTLRRAIVLALFAIGLYFAHVLVLAVAGAAGALVIAAAAPGPRAAALRVAPLLAPAPFVALWAFRTQASESLVRTPDLWAIGAGRVLELPATLLGYAGDREAGAMAALLAVAVVVIGIRPRRSLLAWAPAAVALAAFLLGPFRAFGTFYLYQRFAAFTAPLALAATLPGTSARRVRLGRALLLLLVVGWMGILTLRFQAFDADARRFDTLVAAMVPARRVLALTFEPGSPAVGGFPFLHFAAWYQAEKGGVLGFSFATFFPELARYRAGAEPPMTVGLEWYPELFRWERDGEYDYFVVRAASDLEPRLQRASGGRLALEARDGRWWLYRRVAP
jgi:hypothetical protein